MSLKGRTVRIVVIEPHDWDERNLFGTIIYERGGIKLIVKLTKQLSSKKMKSDLIELKPRYKKETFKCLSQNYSVAVGGALIAEDNDEYDNIIIGNITID